MNDIDFLRRLRADAEFVDYFEEQYGGNLSHFLKESHSGEMALWLLGRLGADAGRMRLLACRCVRETPMLYGRGVLWSLIKDAKSRRAVEVAERFAKGEAKREELYDAYEAAIEAVADSNDNASLAAAYTAFWDANDAVVESASSARKASPWDGATVAQAKMAFDMFPISEVLEMIRLKKLGIEEGLE